MGENLTDHFLPYESASSSRDPLIDSPKIQSVTSLQPCSKVTVQTAPKKAAKPAEGKQFPHHSMGRTDFKRHKFWGHEPGKASEGSVFYTVFEPRGLNISLCDAWCMAEWKRENVKSHIPKNKNVQGFGVLEMGRCREAASLWHLVAACLLVYGGWSCRNVLGFQDPLTYVRLKGFPRSNILQYYSG